MCNRNTIIGAKGLWEGGSEQIKCFYLVFSISRQKGACTIDERGDHPKLTQTEVNITAVADLLKNDHQITTSMIAESLTSPRM
jgi:hypothetical protein